MLRLLGSLCRALRRMPPRDAAQAHILSVASVRWVVHHRAWTPWYLVRYGRFAWLRLAKPHIVTTGLVFLGSRVDLTARKGYGRLEIGRWTHLGSGSAIRCHEGSVRVGAKCVFGERCTVNAYLDIEFGAASIVADGVYVCDFDHIVADTQVPIKDQGIVKSPVRIGPDVWVGTKVTVLRGTSVGRGSVLAAHCVVNRDVPDWSVAVGVPARVVRNRAGERRTAPVDPVRRSVRVPPGLRDDQPGRGSASSTASG